MNEWAMEQNDPKAYVNKHRQLMFNLKRNEPLRNRVPPCEHQEHSSVLVFVAIVLT